MARGFLFGLLVLTGCVRLGPTAGPTQATTRPQVAAATPGGRDDVLRFARSQIGKPYCWGGAGPGCFDCSGLVESSWRQAGVRLPRTSEEMSRQLHEVPLLEAQAGDVLYWPGHVGLYAGGGQVIDATGGSGRTGPTRRQITERRIWGVPRVLRPAGT